MKLLFTSITLIICSASFSQEIRKVEDFYGSGKLYSIGYMKRISYNTEASFGLWTYWYENGQIKMECLDSEDPRLRYINFWTEDGKQTLRNGNGFIFETMAFRTDDSSVFEIKDSLKNGPFKSYAPDKKTYYLNSTGAYNQGLLQGIVTYYRPSGIIFFKRTYDKGIVQGEQISYYNNGLIKEKGNVIDNDYDSTWLFYDSTGNLLKKANYTKDLLSGEYQEYYSNGKLKISGKYIITKNTDKPKRVIKKTKHLKNYSSNPFGGSTEPAPFKSVKSGNWYYYDQNGNLISKKIY